MPAEAYLRTGNFVAARMIDFIEAAILDFRALGHSRILISGETIWCLSGVEGAEQMSACEMGTNPLLRRYPEVTLVCHYDMTQLPGSICMGVLSTHTHVRLPDRMVAGYYRD